MVRRVLGPLAASAIILGTVLPVPVSGQRGGAVVLPEGTGKELVTTRCTQCHALNMIAGSGGYTRQGWTDLFQTMLKLPPEESPVVADYLAKNFPEKPRPAAVVISGPVSVSIKEWMLPTLGQRPHDPLWTPDGSLWWTGMWANVLGRLDPKTGVMKEFPLKSPQSGPHGLVNDRDGNIWYTGNTKALVGRLDPKTGQVTEYPMPDPAARDPHTPIFDRNGMLWFSLQNANMMGRLNPKTGEIKLITMPQPGSRPYGMVIDSKGTLFTVEFGANRVASFDPVTMAVKEYNLPNRDSRPRRIAITSDDMIWYGDYSRGYLGRLNPNTGEVKEWPSPGGPESQPYGITVAKGDIVWYSESAVRPNTLVRFDPKTEKFQTWIIPSGGGVVRNMMATPEGDLVLACSGVNRVAMVDVK